MKKRSIFIITGASKGLGRALAHELSREDNILYLVARKGINKIIREIKNAAVEMRGIYFDLRNYSHMEGLMDRIFKSVNENNIFSIVLINNAGIISPIGFAGSTSIDSVLDNLKVNCVAPIVLSNIFIRKTRRLRCRKAIINISSGAAKKPIAGWSVYCGSKAAIEMFSRCVQQEQSKNKHGVKIHCYEPGAMDTFMQAEIRRKRRKDFPAVDMFIKWHDAGLLNSADLVAKKIHILINKIIQ